MRKELEQRIAGPYTFIEGKRGLIHIETASDAPVAGIHICSIPKAQLETVNFMVKAMNAEYDSPPVFTPESTDAREAAEKAYPISGHDTPEQHESGMEAQKHFIAGYNACLASRNEPDYDKILDEEAGRVNGGKKFNETVVNLIKIGLADPMGIRMICEAAMRRAASRNGYTREQIESAFDTGYALGQYEYAAMPGEEEPVSRDEFMSSLTTSNQNT